MSLRLSNRPFGQIQYDLEILYEQHQRPSPRTLSKRHRRVSLTSTYNGRQEINCGFTRLHDLIAHPDSKDEQEIEDIRLRHLISGDLTESQVAFGEITEGLQKYVRTQDILGWTPLHYVVTWKDGEAPSWIDILLSKGADIDATDIRGWTPLHYSIWSRNLLAFDSLLKKGASVKVVGVDGTTPLHIAATEMWAFEVNKLINHPRQRADQFATDNFGRNPIHLAAQEGNQGVIDSLRLSINEKDRQGRTALHLATFGEHLDTLREIIRCGANLNETFHPFGSGSTYTALLWAVKESRTETVIGLLDAGADVDASDRASATPLHHACGRNNLKMVGILIEHGANVNAENDTYQTPLSLAASSGNLLCVDRLLKAPDIDVDARPGSYLFFGGILQRAIHRGHGDIVRVLVERGAIISQHMVDVAKGLHESRKYQGEDDDEDGDKNQVREAEHRKRPGLKAEDVSDYIRVASLLRNAFEEHVHGELGSIILSELIRRLCPP